MNWLRTLAFALALAVCGTAAAQRLNKDYLNYIKKWDKVAVEQMKKHKIPASITLAQGLLESGAGKSLLCTAHASGLQDLRNRPIYRPLLEGGCFQRLVVLTRRDGVRACQVSPL